MRSPTAALRKTTAEQQRRHAIRQLEAPRGRSNDGLHRLTPRETEALTLMAMGLSNTAIGQRMFGSDNAVHKHVRNIFAKLDLAPTGQTDRRVAAVLRYLDRKP